MTHPLTTMPEETSENVGQTLTFSSSILLADVMRFRHLGYGSEEILYSALFVEGFINDLAEHLQFYNRFFTPGIDDRLIALSALLPGFEADRIQLKLKYQLTYYILNHRALPLGEEPFQSFSLLIEIRDRMVHSRPRIGRAHVLERAIPKEKKFLERLRQIGAIDRQTERVSTTWHDATFDPKFPDWAFKTAVSIVKLIIESINEGHFKEMTKQLTFQGNYDKF